MTTGAEHKGSNEELGEESDLSGSDFDSGMSNITVFYDSLSSGSASSAKVTVPFWFGKNIAICFSTFPTFKNCERGVVVTRMPRIGENVV
jgi:hypothetical protein